MTSRKGIKLSKIIFGVLAIAIAVFGIVGDQWVFVRDEQPIHYWLSIVGIFGWGCLALRGQIDDALYQRKAESTGTFDIKVKDNGLPMGDTLRGELILTAKKPVEDYLLSLELHLFATIEVSSVHAEEGVEKRTHQLASATGKLSADSGSLAKGESRAAVFEVLAPLHTKTKEPVSKLSRWSTADARIIQGMDADELLGAFPLQWKLEAWATLSDITWHTEQALAVGSR